MFRDKTEITILSGNCKGTDLMAERYAKEKGFALEIYPYDWKNTAKWQEFIIGEPEYEKEYFSDKIIVTGHTPTGFIDPKFKGKIWHKNNHIAIDCGAVFGNPLGCICLDTLEEF